MTDLLTETNPFATCRVRPGAIPFFFPPGQSVGQLIDRLHENGWWGQIVGLHGSGKSTLLATLLPELVEVGRRPIAFRLHDGERRLPEGWRRHTRTAHAAVLVIDGYEKIRPWHRFWIRRHCRRHGVGLVVTAHESVALPYLYRTSVTQETACRVVEHLLTNGARRIGLAEIAARLAVGDSNLRETLFDLYDLDEKERRENRQKTKDSAFAIP